MNRFILLFGIVATTLLVGCKSKRPDVDVSSVNITLKFHRFDKELFNTNPDSLLVKTNEFYAKYNEFYKRYVENIIGVGMVKDPALGYSLKAFVTDNYVQELYRDCEKIHTDFSTLQTGLNNAFKYYHHYFPQKNIPEILVFFSAAQYKIVVTDRYLGIAADMYLGKDYKNYAQIGLPAYFIETLDPIFMTSDAMKGWLATEFEATDSIQNLIGTFIHQGKIMYLLDAMMPQESDAVKIGYSQEKLEWCSENEFQLWAYFVDNELLYTKEEKEISKYLMEGPFTSGFPKESPARIGVWLGWQLVNSFMEHNPDISIPQLMAINDYKLILNKSRYKPSK